MPTAATRRERPARRNANYRREPDPPKVFEQVSDVSDLESEEPAVSSEEETVDKIDDLYMSEETSEEVEEEIEEDLMEEDQEEVEVPMEDGGVDEEQEEEDEQQERGEEEMGAEEQVGEVEEQLELGDEDAEGEDEEELDMEETVVVSELADDDFEDINESEEDSEGEELSDFELTSPAKKGRTNQSGLSSKSKQKQPVKPNNNRQRQHVESSRSVAAKKKGVIDLSSASSSKKGDNLVLTKRQRARLNEEYQHDLLELPMEPTRKKHLTEEEIALRKSETARRRKHQSIQRAEQDKMDTINRLLKKQNTKRRSKEDEADNNQDNQKDGTSRKPMQATSFHYVNCLNGSTLSIPIGVPVPISFDKGPNYPPPVPTCDHLGCQHPKKYRSVKNYKYACSMDHLKKIEGR
ncbi:hypothetical protein G9A89_017830 [Geosiphon pyriformis]|nr:hypothetical protein G9A89_017830 [Geosiphon pyriformis]